MEWRQTKVWASRYPSTPSRSSIPFFLVDDVEQRLTCGEAPAVFRRSKIRAQGWGGGAKMPTSDLAALPIVLLATALRVFRRHGARAFGEIGDAGGGGEKKFRVPQTGRIFSILMAEPPDPRLLTGNCTSGVAVAGFVCAPSTMHTNVSPPENLLDCGPDLSCADYARSARSH